MPGLAAPGSTAGTRYTLAAAATVLHFGRVLSAIGLTRSWSSSLLPVGSWDPSPGVPVSPGEAQTAGCRGRNAGASLSTDVTLSPDATVGFN